MAAVRRSRNETPKCRPRRQWAEIPLRSPVSAVVVGGGVVERLPGEADLVLGRGQLLLQGEHVLVGLEVRVRLGQGKEPAQGAAQLGLGLVKLPHGHRVAGVGGDFLLGRHRAVAGVDDGVERVSSVSLGILVGWLRAARPPVAAINALARSWPA
jgi:hypothetical protein